MAVVAVALALLHGIVVRGPTTPVCMVSRPCSAPAVGAVLAFSRGGRVVARARVGAGGRYSVRLAPGAYLVTQAPPSRIGAGVRPGRVRVGVSATVNFFIDTGIR